MNNVYRKRGCQMKSLSRDPLTVHVFRHHPRHGNAPAASSRYRVLCAFALVGAFSTAALAADSDVASVSLTIDPYIAISFDGPSASFDLVVTDGGPGDCDTEGWTASSNLGAATLGVVLVVPPGAPGAWTAVMTPAGPIGPGVTLGSLAVCVSGITLLDEAPAAYAGGSVTITIAPYTTGIVVMR
jgi:hypothetical protein